MQKSNQKFRFGKILLALLFVVVGFTSQTNAASDCPAVAKSGLDANFAGDVNGYLFKNTFGLLGLNENELSACQSYCEGKGGKYDKVGWYIYCKRVVVEGASSGKAAGADADSTAQTIATANAAAATAVGKTAASETAGSGSATGATTGSGSATTGDSSASTGEVIPPADNRYFEVGVQTPFSAAPINADGTETPAGEKILVAKWIADGYKQCDSSAATNSGCDFRCVWQKGNKGLCENLTSGEAWRFIPADGGETGKWQQVIRGSDGIDILTTYTTLIYRWLAGFIGIAAVLLIVIGGIMISSAGANQEGMESGKKLITSALAGLTLLFVSSLVLYTVNPDFFSQTTGVKEFEKEIAVTSTTATAKAATAAKVAGTYTHAEAMKNLNSGYSVTSTIGEIGVGTDRNTSKTTLEGIKKDTVNGINELITACNGSGWSITGASELTGHTSSTDTHGQGSAIDLQMSNTQLANCMGKYTTSVSSTNDGQAFSKLTVNGYKYWILNEGNHYHIEVNTSNAA